MPVEPDQLLRLAQDLAARPDEAAHRSAISRAYYACFHLAMRVSRCQSRGPDSHQKVWWAVEQLGQRKPRSWNYRKAAQLGRGLKEHRRICDYELNEVLDSRQSEEAVIKADKLFKLLLEFSQ